MPPGPARRRKKGRRKTSRTAVERRVASGGDDCHDERAQRIVRHDLDAEYTSAEAAVGEQEERPSCRDEGDRKQEVGDQAAGSREHWTSVASYTRTANTD